MSIRYLHIRHCDDKGHIESHGGITAAYTCTKDDIVFTLARCRIPNVTESGNYDPGDRFCYALGRQIAVNRLRTCEPEDVIPLQHPASEHLAKYIAANYFEGPIDLRRDIKGRWVSSFT